MYNNIDLISVICINISFEIDFEIEKVQSGTNLIRHSIGNLLDYVQQKRYITKNWNASIRT